MSKAINEKNILYLASFVLIVTILVGYWPLHQAGFIFYDDVSYLTDNPWVKQGLSLETLLWALTDFSTGYWHPLTWLSHMLDWQFFGANAAGHHCVSVMIHALNVLMLFWFFCRMTGEYGKSAFVACLFAIHPINVESVAWVAERKNVLSTSFWLLTMIFYVLYAERPKISRYLLILVSFVLGLMAKPMLVTLPFVLLLLDYWPLRRFRSMPRGSSDETSAHGAFPSSVPIIPQATVIRLILEKIPLLCIAIAIGVATFLEARYTGAVTSLDSLSWGTRVIHAINSYVAYIGKLCLPVDLAVFYPYPKVVLIWQIIGSLLFLTAVTIIILSRIRRYPFLGVGWFWFLGTLFPVIGLVQAGGQAMADRYAYVPFIGLFIIMAWGVPQLFENKKFAKWFCGVAASLILVCLSYLTMVQASYWRDSISLYEHTLQAAGESDVVHNNLGIALAEKGRLKEAHFHYQQALRINPQNANAYNNLGLLLAGAGHPLEAEVNYKKSLQIAPLNAPTHNNLAILYAGQERENEAIDIWQDLLHRKPDYVPALFNLGFLYARRDDYSMAIQYYQRIILLQQDDAETNNALGFALFKTGKPDEARGYFLKALSIKPDFQDARNNMTQVLHAIKERDKQKKTPLERRQ